VFLWGVSISAFQNECGGETHIPDSNWKRWLEGKVDFSMGPDYWHNYSTDHKLARALGCNAWRTNIDWCRILKEKGVDKRAVEHYRKILEDAKKRGLKIILNLHHWTFPPWLEGWHTKESVPEFSRFAEIAAAEFGDLVDMWSTMNEPNIEVYEGYITGEFPPGKRSKIVALRALHHVVRAHREAYKILSETGKPTGVILNVLPVRGRFPGKHVWHRAQMHILGRFYKKADWAGVNYYTILLISRTGRRVFCKENCSEMGWYICPEGMYDALKMVSSFGKPIYITENGIADSTDKKREWFIRAHIKQVLRAFSEGVDVRGYFYWTLVDNLEWNHGFSKKFGLFAYDPRTKERIPKPSAAVYANEIKKARQIIG